MIVELPLHKKNKNALIETGEDNKIKKSGGLFGSPLDLSYLCSQIT